jgi:hypothetical protein
MSPAPKRPANFIRLALPLPAVAVGAILLLGCASSESSPGHTPASHAHLSSSKAAKQATTHKPKTAKAPLSEVAKMDASSDRIIAEGKIQIAAGAPSDAEVRKELKAARKAGIVIPNGESVSSFESAEGAQSGPAANASVPEEVWNPRHKPIADWIIPVLEWAHLHGWGGTVTSGYRTFYEQAQLNAAGAYSAPAGLSNHETTVYPGGAVDVTEPAQLISVLRNYRGPRKLIGGVLGPVDPEHFSATGD